tara:strand:+ start:914 stop:1231 length:318 start_codon:yes stop_codon:yes gene_type:complete
MPRATPTKEMKAAAKHILGISSITITQLRLMPTLYQSLMSDDQKLDPDSITAAESKILQEWTKEGWITWGEDHRLGCTKPFWNAVSELLWLSYVCPEGEEEADAS